MAKIGRRPTDDQLLEGGGGGGMAAGFSAAKPRGLSVEAQAARNASQNNTKMVDEMIKLDRQMELKREMSAIKNRPGRQAAEKESVTTTEGGVKKTVYPYAGENEFKKGGKITASKRADGIAQRGKTRGKMI